MEEIEKCLQKTKGVCYVDNNFSYLMPSYVKNKEQVFVGRLRKGEDEKEFKNNIAGDVSRIDLAQALGKDLKNLPVEKQVLLNVVYNNFMEEFKNFVISNSKTDKTVVITRETDNRAVVKIEGSTKPGAMPTVSNFPVRDATADKRYCKQAYSTDGKVFYWISYDIVSDWFAMPKHKKNYTEIYYDGSYGLMTYIYHASYYSGE